VCAQTCTRFAPRPRPPLYDKGVDLKRRPPKSRPTAFPWRIASPPEGGPQGLRRPRFSFFRFTCQTARDDGSPILGRTEGRRSYKLPTEIGSGQASKSEELRRRAIAPSRGRHAVFALYTLRPLRMSTRNGQKSYTTHLQHETAARGPVLTFASLPGGLSCECWNQRTTGKYRASSGALDSTFASRARGW
jgi:hypothetical protein